ncbi:MAG: cobyric acid synthase, partial [Candidatus Humimicrobiaceae bacterium]
MATDSKSLMVQGTSSHVGKSVTVAAICRILKQDGYSVCPFKSQNMALNSFVTASGGEMGRAQVVQAEACGLEPEVFMNPILIKPVADTQAQIIFMGKVLKNMSASEYDKNKKFYLDKIKELLDDIRKKFDYVIIEGAGSPAEINLLKNDIVNMRTAVIAQSPVILVGDVDRGGVFASFYGTVKLLPDNFQKYIKGLLVNKFRGDVDLLQPGNDFIARKLGIPVLGTIPYFRDIYIEEEDSVNLEKQQDNAASMSRPETSKADGKIVIGVIYLPHISNFTDFNALKHEEEVNLIYLRNAADLAELDPHLIIIPGSKSTINDLIYMRRSGLEEEIKKQYI